MPDFYIYIVSSEYTDTFGYRKLGLTMWPVHRLRQYNIGDCPGTGCDKMYAGLWKTNVTTRAELATIEKTLHTHFAKKRIIRSNGNYSEWFAVTLDEVVNYLSQNPFIERRLTDEEIQNLENKESSLPIELQKKHEDEERILSKEQKEKEDILQTHYTILNEFQKSHLEILQEFFGSNILAGSLYAPCGYGKTIVPSKAIHSAGVTRLFICVPTEHLKTSWSDALLKYAGFTKQEIYEIGGNGINNTTKIEGLLQKEKFALLLCYASSHILQPFITKSIQLGIFDEAHRLAGIAEILEEEEDKEESIEEKKRDIGRTKRLIRICEEKGVKRLSLTFTPKGYFLEEEESKNIINSNDDKLLFGEALINVSLRDMIDQSLLPPYQIRFPQVQKNMYEGLKAKVQLVLSEFMKQKDNKFLMNHLILFAASHNDCKDIVRYLGELVPTDSGISVIYLENSASVQSGLERFSRSKRSILVNCQLLGEGANLPIADSVSLLCCKKSYTQIIQNLLRPGRFFPGKEKFYIILPMNDEEDDSEFIESVFESLSRIDPLFERAMLLPLSSGQSKDSPSPQQEKNDKALEDLIFSEEAEWYDIPKIKKCIQTIHKRRLGKLTTRFQFERLRNICREMKVFDSRTYNLVREENNWIENPWDIRSMCPYEFFYGSNSEKNDSAGFKLILKENAIQNLDSYIEWQKNHTEYPTIDSINDGCFGSRMTNFDIFLPSRGRR